jgi:hypothetical protein
MQRILDLRECLMIAFTSQPNFDPQDDECFWAIIEGLARWDKKNEWQEVRARKMTRCVRGCKIEVGHTYFRHTPLKSPDVRFCAACTAMILFFNRVWELPVALYVAWDPERQETVHPRQLVYRKRNHVRA